MADEREFALHGTAKKFLVFSFLGWLQGVLVSVCCLGNYAVSPSPSNVAICLSLDGGLGNNRCYWAQLTLRQAVSLFFWCMDKTVAAPGTTIPHAP
eukprot:1005354-Amphidinium_carterae.1